MAPPRRVGAGLVTGDRMVDGRRSRVAPPARCTRPRRDPPQCACAAARIVGARRPQSHADSCIVHDAHDGRSHLVGDGSATLAHSRSGRTGWSVDEPRRAPALLAPLHVARASVRELDLHLRLVARLEPRSRASASSRSRGSARTIRASPRPRVRGCRAEGERHGKRHRAEQDRERRRHDVRRDAELLQRHEHGEQSLRRAHARERRAPCSAPADA